MEISSHLGQCTATEVHPTLPSVTAFQTVGLREKKCRGEQSALWGKIRSVEMQKIWALSVSKNVSGTFNSSFFTKTSDVEERGSTKALWQ